MTYPEEVLIHLEQQGIDRASAKRLLDTHAIGLARQIRNWDAEAAGYTDPQMAVYAAADLIDPYTEG